MIRALILLVAAFALASCGLRPLYAPGSGGAALYNRVEIPAMPGEEGYLVRAQLIDQLGEVPAGETPAYRLQVVLDDDISGIGLRGDTSITRERRTLRARYRLIDATTGAVVTDATAGADAGIDVVSSEYATIAAEDRALENLSRVVARDIVAQLGLALQRRAAPDAAGGEAAP